MCRLYPLVDWIKSTWVGQKLLLEKPADNSGLGILLRFRDKLVDQRLKDIGAGMTTDRIDMLQRYMASLSLATLCFFFWVFQAHLRL